MLKHATALLLFAFLLPTFGAAQVKKVDDSGKKPVWSENAMEQSFLIGMGEGENRDLAKDRAMLDIKEQITEAVAVQVKSVSKMMINNLVQGQNPETTTEFQQESSTETAKRDFLYGISASKIEDFYWEKYRNKKTGSISFSYWVKYPFSEAELNELIRNFKKKDRELTQLLNETLATTENYQTIEELESARNQLQELHELFIDNRKSKAKLGMEDIRGLLKSIYLADAGSKPGMVRYSLKIGDKTVTTSKRPHITSNCADIQRRDFGSKVNEISYSDEYCYDEPGNFVQVRYRIANRQLLKKFPIDKGADKVAIELLGTIGLLPEKGEIRLKIHSGHETPIVIKTLELTNDVLGLKLYEEINRTLSFKGKKDVTFTIAPFEVREGYNAAEVNGYIHYQAENGSEEKSMRIYRVKARILEAER